MKAFIAVPIDVKPEKEGWYSLWAEGSPLNISVYWTPNHLWEPNNRWGEEKATHYLREFDLVDLLGEAGIEQQAINSIIEKISK